ncbi:EAL domain-containing protein [Zwartia sp.]|uniref:bifunctional diguanylate cyclase/phosphodiesterase n=1 Tax=Zwartia sp. TaxID=2978004 RepID=UPI002722C4B2|nr:EAL domain-containing protein [Zwartia sp.]MDO9024913.1 EAL domain-containing protein [Zwartia sp.]
MNLTRFQKNSLKTRITFFTLLIFLPSIWILGYFANQSQRENMQRILGDHQYAVASLMAADIQEQIAARVAALERVARTLSQRRITQPRDLQDQLNEFPIFQSLFNGGTFITNINGEAIASLPIDLDRIGVNYIDRDYISNALRNGVTTIGRPVIGRQLNTPVFGMGTPIQDVDGNVVAVLAGVINLGTTNFMDRIENSYAHRSSNFLLVDATHRVIVASSEKDRLMELLPAPMVSPILDKFIQGYDGNEIFKNPRGIEVITAVKPLSSPNWYVAVSLPTSLAFAPVKEMERQLFLFTLLLTIISGSAVWWMLVRQLQPLQSTAQQLAQLSNSNTALKPLPVFRQDEIGMLISGFNRLLTELAARQETLRESEARYRTIFRTSPDAVSITRLRDGRYIDINDGFSKIFGWEREQVIGKTSLELGIWALRSDRTAFMDIIQKQGSCQRYEVRFVGSHGQIIYAQTSANTLLLNDEPCLLAVTQDITANKQASDHIEYLEYFDALTGLANLRMMMKRLTLALEERSNLQYQCALIYFDLDDFKSMNDAFGHDKGDLWLKEVAKRISEVLHEGDLVARISGDKFVVLLSGLSAISEEAASAADAIAQKILLEINQPFTVDPEIYQGSCCLGIALTDTETDDAVAILKHAEVAMYQAKAAGRQTIRFFDPGMQKLISTRVALEADLRESLKRGDFVLYYQQQINHLGVLVGVEALIRWHHPRRGIVTPGYFIQVAEQSGIIIPIGRWVLETACKQLALWSKDPKTSHLTISVNVSATQFHEDKYVDHVLSVLTQTRAPGNRLKLELTESMLVNEIESLIKKLTILKAHGIGFSLDDFGTGFSSLSYLQRLPLDQLKIDQSFVTNVVNNESDAAIVQTIVTLGNSLGISVIAEGVETIEQRARLHELGCELYQGYLYGKPAPIDQILYSL